MIQEFEELSEKQRRWLLRSFIVNDAEPLTEEEQAQLDDWVEKYDEKISNYEKV